MARKRKQVIKAQNLKRSDIYNGTMECPVCQKEVSVFRVACFLNTAPKHSDFMGMCPICRK